MAYGATIASTAADDASGIAFANAAAAVLIAGCVTVAPLLGHVVSPSLGMACAVLLGAPYPFEARGRIAWPLLDAGSRRKAEGTITLARQRSGLVVGTLPLGAVYPPALRTTILLLPDVDAAIAQGQYTYAYQLGSSALDQSDSLLETMADAAPLPIPRRAAPNLVAACVAVALYAVQFGRKQRTQLA